MIEAIKFALRYDPSPNPRVGAVLVDKNNKIKKLTAHTEKDKDHAEYNLVKNTDITENDTLYVTLEPCFHDDTSPSCANAVLETNVQNIVVGDIDRDERTNGKGIELLKNNDLNVSIENGVNDFLNPGYKIKNDKPYLIGKVASSADHIICLLYTSPSQRD